MNPRPPRAVSPSFGAATDEAFVNDLKTPMGTFSYNPSAWTQRLPVCALALVAFFIAGYMGLFQWGLVPTAWDPIFGKQTADVLTSDTAKTMEHWIGIPDAALGALAYLGDAIFGLAGSTRRWRYRPWLVILFGIDVIPLGIVSSVLVLIQATVLQEWCFLCLVTAVISLVLVYFAYDECFLSLHYLWKVWKEERSLPLLWKTFLGRPTEESDRIALSMIGE